MYARPELSDALDLFWANIRNVLRDDGIDAPEKLTPNGFGYEFWRSPNLLLGQTCGYPYRVQLRKDVQFVGTLDYGVEGCAAGHYCSVILVHENSSIQSIQDLSEVRFAYNDNQSQSGFHGPYAWAKHHDVAFHPSLETGAHRMSVEAVANGDVDVAAIDAITWSFIQRYDDVAKSLRVIATTPPMPSLPLICAKAFDPERIANAVETAIDKLAPKTKEQLSIRGLSKLSSEDYSNSAFSVN